MYRGRPPSIRISTFILTHPPHHPLHHTGKRPLKTPSWGAWPYYRPTPMHTTPAGIAPPVCFYVSLYACLNGWMDGDTGRVDSTRATHQGLSSIPARQHTHTHAHTQAAGGAATPPPPPPTSAPFPTRTSPPTRTAPTSPRPRWWRWPAPAGLRRYVYICGCL